MANRRTDASVAFSATDNLSESIVGMRNSLNQFKNDTKGLQQQLDVLSNTRFQLKNIDLKAAQQELARTKRAFEELGEAASDAEREAARADFAQATQNYENIQQQLRLVSKQAKQTERDLLDASNVASKLENRAGRSGSAGVLSALGAAGLGQMAGDAVLEMANGLVGSIAGDASGAIVSSGLSGIVSGASMGALAGPGGAAVGAALGGILGVAQGGAQALQAQDEAFKAYYAGLYDTQAQAREEGITSGSATAAQRELDAIAFNRLLGAGVGDQYLASLRTLAADTPLEYADLTDMSRALAVGFGDSPERMLELMTAIGDAGSAVGLTAADMTEMARALSWMNSSGRATLEYLNILQDRGVNVIQMLADEYGKTQGEIYDMISRGEINGRDAASIIQAGMESAYSGAMDEMASTFSGLTSTLEDTMAEITAGYGTGYNRERSRGMEQEIADYGGSLGDVMARVNELAGENAAYLENLQEQYTREALSAVLLDRDTTLFGEEDRAQLEELRQAFSDAWDLYEETGDRNAALTMQYTQEAAGAIAQAAYEASDQYKMTQDAEADSLEALRSNTSALEASTAAYQLEQERSKGALSGLAEDILAWSSGIEGPEVSDSTRNTYMNALAKRQSREEGSHAAGLGRVPYDNYAALLHEGERVLTASQARELDRGGSGGGVTVNLSGSWTVRSEEDAEELAEILVRKIELAQKAGVIG